MFDALGQVGGQRQSPRSLARSQPRPIREIALLAKNLEKLEPGQHRQEVLAAAQEA
jgi:hypothetical protein